nr:hypothetical protein [Oscillospiraceae bacterium]
AALRTRIFAACAQSDPASELLLRLGRADGARWEFTARAYDAACPAENAAAGSFRIAGQFIRADGTAGSGLTIPVGADGSYRLGGGMSGALNVLVMRELREGGGSATITALSPDGLRLFATDPAQFTE